MHLEIYDMYCFKLLAENLNFTKVSKQLGESQPALSKRIKKIEDDLGYRLFERSTRSIALTREGEAFYRFSSRVLNLYNELEEDLDRKDTALKIGYNYEWQFQLIMALNSELSKHSKLKVELVKCREEDLEGGIDLYFTTIRKFVSQYKHKYIARNGLSAYVSIYHTLAKNKELSLKDLMDENLIVVHLKNEEGKANYHGQQIFDTLIRKGVPESHIIFDKNRTDMVFKICAENLIGIMYDNALLLENSEIVKIPLTDLREVFSVYLIYKNSKRVEEYLQYLERVLDVKLNDPL